MDELASGLGGGAAAGALRAKLRRLETGPRAAPLAAPLAAPARARLERGAAYDAAKEHVTRWQPLVKANREAATLSFPAPRDAAPRAADTTAALVAAFTPEKELERQVAALLDAGGAASAAAVRQAEALALNAGTVEEAKERQARLAKMRSLLFFHEAKARRLKAIKSKGFHRHEAARLRALARKLGDTGSGDAEEAAKAEEAAELARVTERFGLKHRNTSRWARRAIAKGIAHLPGTREALQEQIRLGQTLRRKANAAPGSRADREDGGVEDDGVDASDDDDDDDDGEGGSDGGDPGAGAARRRAAAEARAHATAMDVLAGGTDGAPAGGKGLQALPFMVKAQAKQKAAAAAAAKALLAELDGNADGFAGADDWGGDGEDPAASGPAHGRRTFAGAGDEDVAGRGGEGDEDWDGGDDDGSDSEAREARLERAEAAAARRGGARAKQQAAQAAQAGGTAKPQAGKGGAGFGLAVAAASAGVNPARGVRSGGAGGPASGMDAARASAASHAFAFEQPAPGADAPSANAAAAPAQQLGSKERRKERRRQELAGGAAAAPGTVTIAGAAPSAPPQRTAAEAAAAAAAAAAENAAAAAEAADPDALIGGVSARQRALIAAAFAGDDVAAEFAAAKAAEVEAELPKAEVASQLPGWGAWAGEQKEPRWLRDQRKAAEAARASAAAKRQDAGKKHVIISEKYDHKAAAFTSQTLPYPFTSRDAFEGAMRVPMGRETNTDAAFRDMTRPKVLKQPGTIIAPIKFTRAPAGAGRVDKPKRR